MQNRQSGGRRRRGGGGGGGGNNPRPMGMSGGGQSANRLEVRVRGNAHQLLEKYKQLARDAHQAGDRVAAEYYLQHSDHYFRVLNDSRIRQEEMRARRGVFDQFEDGGSDESDDMQADSGEEQIDERPRQSDRQSDRQQQPRADGERPRRFEARDQQPREQREPREQRAERPMRSQEPAADDADDGDRRQRWQDRRPERARDDREPRVTADAGESRLSDGEAALVAFGGAPAREPVEDAAEAEAPKPRRRGRPRKAEAEPVEG